MTNRWLIKKTNLLSTLLIIVLCIPPSFAERMGLLAFIYKYVKWGALLYAVLLLVRQRGKFDKIDIAVFLWFIYSAFSVIINGTGLYIWFSKYYPYFTVYIVARYRIKTDSNGFVKLLVIVFTILILGNFLSWWWPGDKPVDELKQELFLLGIRTRISDVIFIGLTVGLMSIELNQSDNTKWKICCILILISGIWFIIGEWVSTSIIGLIIFGILLLLLKNKRFDLRKWAIPLVGISLLLSYLVVAERVRDEFSWLIEDVLGEDISLTGRTVIWESLINQMQDMSWIFGNGLEFDTGFTVGNRLTSAAHSQYLQVIYNHGLVGLAIFISLPVISMKMLLVQTNNKIASYLIICMLVMLITGLTEITCDTIYYYLVLAMLASVNNFDLPFIELEKD